MNRWNSMRERVEDYLNARRRLGYQLKAEGRKLLEFARYADQQGTRNILTIELAIAWANTLASRINRARSLEVVRGLAKYCILFEPETQILPPRLLGPAHRRLAPYIYTRRDFRFNLGGRIPE